ncbi:MAG: Crossover junction endodeoxyribonuclease RuvC [Candidatus Roizmanbacteria bacterium GW2011_GWC2_37_13]|uniref:Crossover junction endodeoxyribonuclease RuvC n=1 Tax=Candidatus Roizmanbacteria bacterium GW2011_GWC2_37_13 TaxID=1618486 RepID=A0A0G0GI09_9BACT|nr:MAG: Crossover junction endodeoxyribonuclease RuvC [Candidatus Roizmanbacteria bacterium GW2011_GWC1_37_12]KKQ25735.1 MAG: Crossover junction endodeoxyribonuclease RuvC [Candidatus Roizmanbacteria bacterium GW2011_GWC2_37_13]
MIILAIDSGIEKTGYAIFKNKKYVTSALIKTKKSLTTEKRLMEIYFRLKEIIKKHQPDKIILERLFFFKNQKTAILVSQAQGVCLLLAAQNKISVGFLTPLQIKQAITGYGQADKKSVQKMIRLEMGIDITQDDEADAVACGLAYILIGKV